MYTRESRLLPLAAAAACAIACILSAPAAARAASSAVERAAPEPFGQRGQLVLPNLLTFGYQGFGHTVFVNDDEAETMDGTSWRRTSVEVTPSMDGFVANRWSLGATVQVAHWRERGDFVDPEVVALESHTTQLGGFPRVGYAIPLGTEVSFWPRLGAGYTVSFDDDGMVRHGVQASAEVPLLFHLGRYVFVSAGLGATVLLSHGELESATALRRERFVALTGSTALGLTFGR